MALLSNQVLTKIITDIHKIIEVDCSVWSKEGKCLVSTCEDTQKMNGQIEKFVETEKSEKISRVALHSSKITFFHPISGEIINILCILPSDLCAIIEKGGRSYEK